MRIRSLLITVIVLAFGVVATRLAVLEVRTEQSHQLDRVQLDVERVSRDAASLLVLSQDYLLHESPRAAQQWRATQAELARTLPRVATAAPALQAQAEVLTEVTSGLPELFEAIELAANDDGGSDADESRQRRDMLADHMVGETRRISDGAFEMAETLAHLRQLREQTERRVTQATMAAFGALMLLLAVVVTRRVLRPMVQLEAAAQAVQDGNLGARSGWQARDEFGRLSRVFDQMTQTLQDRDAHLAASNQHLQASEASLAAARRDLRNILDAVPSMIGYWDKDLVNRFANHAYQAWFGVDPAGLPGTHVEALLTPELYQRNLPHMQAALRGEPQHFQGAIPRPDGTGLRHSMNDYVPDISGGEVRGFYVLVHDISELTESRVQLNAAQRDNEALLSTIRMHAIVSVTDAKGCIVEVNDVFCQLSGYSREELLGQSHRVVHSGVQGPGFWRAVWARIGAGEPWRGEVCNRAKDGSLYWVDSMIAPFVGADGRIEKYISIRTDITAAKLAEQKLRASEAFLDRAGEIAGVGAWEVDLRSMALTWSAQTRRIHEAEPGYQPSLNEGLSFYAPEGRLAIELAVNEAIAEGTGWDLELPLITAKCRAIWVRTVGAVEFEGGQAVKLVGAFQDITRRRQDDAMLQEAHDRFEIAADSANIGVWEFDLLTNSLAWDERMYRLYQRERTASAEPYTLWSTSLHPDDRQRAEAELGDALRGEGHFDTEFRIVWPDGDVRHLRANARVQRDAEGHALRMTGVNIDITDRKRADLKLLETSSLLESVLESASEVAIVATDPKFNITVFNAGAEKMLGHRRDEVLGCKTLMLSAPSAGQPALDLGDVAGGDVDRSPPCPFDPDELSQTRDWTYTRKDGSTVPVSLVVTALRDGGGALLGYLAVAHDVTRQKHYEDSLRDAMNRAEQASRAKTEFLANMSHEIRTPMNAVIGLSYLLRRTPLDGDQAELLSRVDLASRSLLAVINDVLDLSKIEAGEMTVERVAFSLPVLLHDLGEVMTVPADAKGIALDIAALGELNIAALGELNIAALGELNIAALGDPNSSLAERLSHALDGDAPRLRQILTNLLSNAIKFTERGRVALRVLPLAVHADRVKLRFEIQDTGIGISPEAGARIFMPFAQADTSTTRRYGGTGLGLSIVKRLVGLMGGEVGFNSTAGQGSCFWVELTFGVASEEAVAREEAPPAPIGRGLPGVRVLVVDDSDINLAVARRILELEGAAVTVAGDGQHAFDLLKAAPTDFDVVLMDVQMPVLDGHEATRRIREELGLRHLPIVALTAGALSSERQRATAAGMDDFISKPFHAKALIRSIRRHVQRALEASTLQDAPVWASAALGTSGAEASRQEAARAVPWPEVEGIDTHDVRSRLGGDVALFRAMLKQLFTEFADIDQSAASDTAQGVRQASAQRAESAARLHKLKGSAGMLGAKAIQELAGLAEMDCRAPAAATPRVPDWGPRLAAQLRELMNAASAVTEAPMLWLPPAEDDGSPLPLDSLLELLRGNQLQAVDEFKALAPRLRQRMAAASHDALCEHMGMLRFGEAVKLLMSLEQTTPA